MTQVELKVFEILGAELETVEGERGSAKREFAIIGAETPQQAHSAFVDFVRANYPKVNGVPAKRFRLIEKKESGNKVYKGEVEYRIDKDSDKNTDEEGNEFTRPSFSLRGGTKRIKRPYALTDRSTVRGKEAVEYALIGWDGQEFTGCEVEAPNLEFMVPQLVQATAVNFQFVIKLASLVGSVNEDSFYGLDKGECLYLGPEESTKTLSVGKDLEGNEQYELFVELQHHFKCQPNLYQVTIGGCEPVDIPGWDYVDIHYRKELRDVGDGELVEVAVPEQVDVWQVRPYEAFSQFGL